MMKIIEKLQINSSDVMSVVGTFYQLKLRRRMNNLQISKRQFVRIAALRALPSQLYLNVCLSMLRISNSICSERPVWAGITSASIVKYSKNDMAILVTNGLEAADRQSKTLHI